MVAIPAGTFTMGCVAGDSSCDSSEEKQHLEQVSAFSLGKTEVTVAAYETCVNAGACTVPVATLDHCNWGRGLGNLPVNCVSWHQAVSFCTWMGGRLPTAAEWEYAAKGGEPRIFPWGNESPEGRANFDMSGTMPVGSYPQGASKWGVLDLAGNVWEWTASDYEGGKEVRGGGWNSEPQDLRTSNRLRGDPSFGYINFGFRCAR